MASRKSIFRFESGKTLTVERMDVVRFGCYPTSPASEWLLQSVIVGFRWMYANKTICLCTWKNCVQTKAIALRFVSLLINRFFIDKSSQRYIYFKFTKISSILYMLIELFPNTSDLASNRFIYFARYACRCSFYHYCNDHIVYRTIDRKIEIVDH